MPSRARSKSARPSYVVIGTSAGGVRALSRIFRDLPENFPGAILIVMHVSSGSGAWLSERLTGLGPVPVKVAQQGERIRQGTAYVAPAGAHLQILKGRVDLGSGPRENFSRPAIDVLFRSAADAFGRRVVGVILTGMLRDGTLGLRAVSDGGGITVVQNPERAEEGDMPRNAMKTLNVDYCIGIEDIGPLLELLVRRAGSHKKGILETGLASSVRIMRNRARLLASLVDQSQKNAKTTRFLKAEVAALGRDIDRIQRLIPAARTGPRFPRARRTPRAVRAAV